jgi:hypothetical protein
MHPPIFFPVVALSLLLPSHAHADRPPPASCDELYAGACLRGGACTSVCGSWCAGSAATTACKVCVVTELDDAWDACYYDPPPPAGSCSGLPACTGSEVYQSCGPYGDPCDAGLVCSACCAAPDQNPIPYCAGP